MEDNLAGFPGYALRRAASTVMSDLALRLEPCDLRITEASVLMLIGEQRDVTASQIGRILDIQRANMVPLLNRIEAKGLIERLPIDRKSMAVVLTAAGMVKLAEAKKVVVDFEKDLLARIPEEHRHHLLPALEAVWRTATD